MAMPPTLRRLTAGAAAVGLLTTAPGLGGLGHRPAESREAGPARSAGPAAPAGIVPAPPGGPAPPGPVQMPGERGGPGPILNACGPPARPDYWMKKLTDEDPGLRAMAARALGEIRDRGAIPALIGALRDRSPEVRIAAAQALGRFGPDASLAVPALKQLAADSDRRLAGEAERALERITRGGAR